MPAHATIRSRPGKTVIGRIHHRLVKVAVLIACGVISEGAVRAEPSPLAADRLPRGVLDTAQGGFLPGRLVPVPAVAGGRDTFAWQSPAFTAPFEFFIDEVEGIRFGPAAAGVAAGPWRLMLRGGDMLAGTLEALDADTVTLGVAGRNVRVRRGFVEQLSRGDAGGGVVPSFGWSQTPAGSWRPDAGGWATSQRGAALQRDVDDAAPRLIYDVEISWEKSPAFRIAASVDGGTEPYRVELFAAAGASPIDSLLVVREEGKRAAIQTVADAIPPASRERLPAGRLRLLLFVDQVQGRLAVSVPDSGNDAAVVDIVLPPDAGRRAGRRFRLTSGGAVRLESLRVSRWTDEAAALPQRQGTTVMGRSGPLASGGLESLDAVAGELVMRTADESQRVPLAEVNQIVFPVVPAPNAPAPPAGPPPIRVSCLHEQAVHGRLLKIDAEAVWLDSDACTGPLAVPHGMIVAFAGARRAGQSRPLPSRVGTLRLEGLEIRGSFGTAADGSLAWQPLGSRHASPFVAAGPGGPDGVVEYVADSSLPEGAGDEESVGGMGGMVNHDQQGACVVTRLSPAGAAARDGRIDVGDRVIAIAPEKGSEFVDTQGVELADVMNLLRGRIGSLLRLKVVDSEGMNPREVDLLRGDLGVRSNHVLQEALEAHARLAPGEIEIEGRSDGFPALLFLRTGDVMPCAVVGIDAAGVRIHTPASAGGDPAIVPAVDVKAVELAPQAPLRTIEAARRERLLTLPRSQRFDPPTHLVRLMDGDYIRGRVVSLDATHIVIALPGGEDKQVLRQSVARVIWLHPQELTGAEAPGRAQPIAGTRAQGVAADGTRITLAVDSLQEGKIRGRVAAIGPGVIDVAVMDRVLLGGAIDREAGTLPYQQWKLKPAPEPRALRGPRDERPAAAGLRIPVSAMAGRAAPKVTLARVTGRDMVTDRVQSTAFGRILVLEFWSEWSEPCRETVPAVVAAAREQPAGVVEVIPVSVGDPPAKAAAALMALGLDSTAIDPDRALSGAFEVRDVPARAIIGPDGLVVDVLRGAGPEAIAELRAVLAATVAETVPLRRDLARLDEVRGLAARGDRECLERIVPLLSSAHTAVRRECVALLRRLVPTAVPPESIGPAQLTADFKLDREVAAWRRWIAREGLVVQLRPTPVADSNRRPVPERGRLVVCLANEVRELSPDGQQLWAHAFMKPAACAGLPNGHRLVGSAATPGKVVEFDADGKEVWSLADLPAGVTSVARLADGNTLVGFADTQRVAEYDATGRQVWEAPVVGRPCAVSRRAGGTTLVACRESDRIVEIDREGGEVASIDDLHGLQGATWLANGNVLVALTDTVVELEPTGTVVWSQEGFNNATAADRLADGRTLVLDAQPGVIVELDATGRERGRKGVRGGRTATQLDAY